MDGETLICHECVGEKYVKSVIKAQGTRKKECSYCHHRRTNMPVTAIADLMHQVFEDYYQPLNNYYYSEMDSGDDAKDVIQNELEVDENVAVDLYQELCEQHNNYYSPDDQQPYDDDYVYGKRRWSAELINQGWENMKKSLTSETRFFNRTVKLFLDNLFNDLDTFRTDKEESPIKEWDVDSRFYRARHFESLRTVEKELRHPERNFGPPPSHLARSGRMNAHGITVFYGATVPDIAIAEIRPPVGAHVIVVPFKPLKPLRILDISALDALVFKKQSIFDPKTIEVLQKTAFLKTFSNRLTLPVFDNQDSSYLITQVIAEYLSVSAKYNLDGISFRSTQVRKEAGTGRNSVKQASGFNVVLFSKSSGVMYSGANERAYKVDFMENLEDDVHYFHPSISLIMDEHSDKNDWGFPSIRNKDKALELIVTDIQYYRIEGIQFQKSATAIELGTPVKPRYRPEHHEPF